jgi:hypothetical protein
VALAFPDHSEYKLTKGGYAHNSASMDGTLKQLRTEHGVAKPHDSAGPIRFLRRDFKEGNCTR